MQFGWACALLLAFCASCSQVREIAGDFQALKPVSSEVAKALKHNAIGVKIINGQRLSVSIVNYPLKDVTEEQKRARAAEAAQAAFQAYAFRSKLKDVIVAFTTHQNYGGVLKVESSSGAYRFPAATLIAGSSQPPEPDR
jgi:hypothetical protein